MRATSEMAKEFKRVIKENGGHDETVSVLIGLCSTLKDPIAMTQRIIDECKKKTPMQDILEYVIDAVKEEKGLEF